MVPDCMVAGCERSEGSRREQTCGDAGIAVFQRASEHHSLSCYHFHFHIHIDDYPGFAQSWELMLMLNC